MGALVLTLVTAAAAAFGVDGQQAQTEQTRQELESLGQICKQMGGRRGVSEEGSTHPDVWGGVIKA